MKDLRDLKVRTIFAWSLPSSASRGLADYSQVDKLGVRKKTSTFERRRARAHQIGEPKKTETELDFPDAIQTPSTNTRWVHLFNQFVSDDVSQ